MCSSEWTRGACVDDALPEVLRELYVRAFDTTLRSGRVWEHEYDCSSPERARRFRMRVLPVDGVFLVVVNTRVIDQPHAPGPSAELAAYEREGIVRMCAHCRRVNYRADPLRWDWVPALLTGAQMNISHALCELCAVYYRDSDLIGAGHA